MRVLKAFWPWLRRAWEFAVDGRCCPRGRYRFMGGRLGDVVQHWSAMAVGIGMTTLVWLANLYVNATPWVLALVAALLVLSYRSAQRERRELAEWRAGLPAEVEQRLVDGLQRYMDKEDWGET